MLLDTHTWIWYIGDDPALGREARAAIEQSRKADTLFLCPITFWEITLKVSQGKMDLQLPVRIWLEKAFLATGVRLTTLDIDVACECAELPAAFHGDPGDRLIAATARAKGLTLITHDGKLLKLAKQGYFKAIAT